MRKIYRIIPRSPQHQIWYLIDTNFLVNRYLDSNRVSDPNGKRMIDEAQKYWKIIDAQLRASNAKIFIVDLCIAETFKTLAKLYYKNTGMFRSVADYTNVKNKLSKDIRLSTSEVRKSSRHIKYHDIQTSRDIIIGVDRFFEQANKVSVKIGIVDLLILSVAKYLTDFYGFSKDDLFIITQDRRLYSLGKKLSDLPKIFNPAVSSDAAEKVFQ